MLYKLTTNANKLALSVYLTSGHESFKRIDDKQPQCIVSSKLI